MTPLAIVQELPDVSIGDAAAVTEGGTAQFTITLSNTYTYDVKVYYQTQNGSATDGSDYTGKIGYVIIPAGQTTATVNVATLTTVSTSRRRISRSAHLRR